MCFFYLTIYSSYLRACGIHSIGLKCNIFCNISVDNKLYKIAFKIFLTIQVLLGTKKY